MFVAEYEASFARLEWFAQAFDSEERRGERFRDGLQPSLRVKVMGCCCATVAEVVQMAPDLVFRKTSEYRKKLLIRYSEKPWSAESRR